MRGPAKYLRSWPSTIAFALPCALFRIIPGSTQDRPNNGDLVYSDFARDVFPGPTVTASAMFEVVVKLRVYKIWVAGNEVASWAQVLPDGTPLSEPWP